MVLRPSQGGQALSCQQPPGGSFSEAVCAQSLAVLELLLHLLGLPETPTYLALALRANRWGAEASGSSPNPWLACWPLSSPGREAAQRRAHTHHIPERPLWNPRPDGPWPGIPGHLPPHGERGPDVSFPRTIPLIQQLLNATGSRRTQLPTPSWWLCWSTPRSGDKFATGNRRQDWDGPVH